MDLPTDVAIQITGYLAATSERPMDDLRALRVTCHRMHLMCCNPEVGRRINVAGLTDMAMHTPEAYHTFVARQAQLSNLEASFIHGVNVVFRGPVITPLAVLDENIERAAAGRHEVAAYVAAVLLYMANGGTGVDATTRQYLRQAAMIVDNTWPRPVGVRDDMFRECFRIRRSAAHVVWRSCCSHTTIRSVSPTPTRLAFRDVVDDADTLMEARWRHRSSLAELPTDLAIKIAGRLAATSEQPMDDLRALRATCRRMLRVWGEPEVDRRIEVGRFADNMSWNNPIGYATLVSRLTKVGNPEVCFLTGIEVAFRKGTPFAPVCTVELQRAAEVGHNLAAYMAAILLYRANDGAVSDDAARWYMR
ncbi:hypothetical protein C2845_PM07G10200 [Panicum miliaceum]|uniref:F-box domain-containing protein n=1 Tax=Panicum miliaceum TaxID=4540 RepID=A0A3L6SSM5_PANMI|nr:hypothetical protein C2845_PM07G10200 [Panicum miliaceum]